MLKCDPKELLRFVEHVRRQQPGSLAVPITDDGIEVLLAAWDDYLDTHAYRPVQSRLEEFLVLFRGYWPRILARFEADRQAIERLKGAEGVAHV